MICNMLLERVDLTHQSCMKFWGGKVYFNKAIDSVRLRLHLAVNRITTINKKQEQVCILKECLLQHKIWHSEKYYTFVKRNAIISKR